MGIVAVPHLRRFAVVPTDFFLAVALTLFGLRFVEVVDGLRRVVGFFRGAAGSPNASRKTRLPAPVLPHKMNPANPQITTSASAVSPFILEFDPVDGEVEFAAQTIGGTAAHEHSGDKYLHVFHDARLLCVDLQVECQAHLLFVD